jgi:hypothetical protein
MSREWPTINGRRRTLAAEILPMLEHLTRVVEDSRAVSAFGAFELALLIGAVHVLLSCLARWHGDARKDRALAGASVGSRRRQSENADRALIVETLARLRSRSCRREATISQKHSGAA